MTQAPSAYLNLPLRTITQAAADIEKRRPLTEAERRVVFQAVITDTIAVLK